MQPFQRWKHAVESPEILSLKWGKKKIGHRSQWFQYYCSICFNCCVLSKSWENLICGCFMRFALPFTGLFVDDWRAHIQYFEGIKLGYLHSNPDNYPCDEFKSTLVPSNQKGNQIAQGKSPPGRQAVAAKALQAVYLTLSRGTFCGGSLGVSWDSRQSCPFF